MHLLKEQIGLIFILNANEFIIWKQFFWMEVNIVYKNTEYVKQNSLYKFKSAYYQNFSRVEKILKLVLEVLKHKN